MNFNIGDFILIEFDWVQVSNFYGIVIGHSRSTSYPTKHYRIRQLNGGSGLYPIEMIKLIAKAKQ